MTWIINCIIGAFTKVIRRRPKKKYSYENLERLLWVCDNKDKSHPDIPYTWDDVTKEIVNEAIAPALEWIQNRHDCSDFRMLNLLKLRFSTDEFLKDNEDIELALKECFTGFKFWIKSPGHDSMCYYSENHLLAFCVCEYIAGQLYENEIFSIDKKTGREHTVIAKKRMMIWFDQRNKYGFSEFLSNNYTPINLAALAILIHYCDDADIVALAKNMTDLILTEYAITLFDMTFVNASARAYPRNNMNATFSEPNSTMVIESVWGDKQKAKNFIGHTAYMFTSMLFAIKPDGTPFYEVPQKIIDLGNAERQESRMRFGLDLKDYKKHGFSGLDDASLMMMLSSGALTNPEIINTTMDMVHTYDLWTNDFVSWMRFIEVPLLRWLGLMPVVSKIANYFANGMAIQRADVYNYKTKYYKLSCVQGYMAGSSGAQKTTVIATLKGGVTVYTMHPLRVDKNTEGRIQFDADRSPSYFGGYGVAPYAVADKNVALCIHKLPLFRRLFAPFKMLYFTHAFFPEQLFTKTVIDDRYAFATCNGGYIALIGKNELVYAPYDENIAKSAQGRLNDAAKRFDLIQKGRKQYWIYVLSDEREEAFEAFMQRVKKADISFDGNTLVFDFDKRYTAKYNKGFTINGKNVNLRYERYDADNVKMREGNPVIDLDGEYEIRMGEVTVEQ